MGDARQIINDPASKLSKEDWLWARHSLRNHQYWCDKALEATTGQVSIILAHAWVDTARGELERLSSVLEAKTHSPWHTEGIPVDYLKVVDSETYAEHMNEKAK